MKGLIHCSEFGNFELLPQKQKGHLLPICNKSLIEYQLEALYTLGIREVRILTSELGPEIQTLIGNGSRYGMQVSYQPGHPDSNALAFLSQNLGFIGQDDLLVISGQVLPIPGTLQSQLEGFRNQDLVQLTPFQGLQQNAFYLSNQGIQKCLRKESLKWTSEQLRMAGFWQIQSLQDLHQFNVEFFHQWQAHVSFPGYTKTPSYQMGRAVKLHPTVQCMGFSQLGNEIFISENVQLEDAMIGDQVFVGENTTIKKSVILNGVQIGEDLHIEGKIVTGTHLIDPISESALFIDNANLLDDRHQIQNKLSEKLLAAALYLVKAPLYHGLKSNLEAPDPALIKPGLHIPTFKAQGLKGKLFHALSLHKTPLYPYVLTNELALFGQQIMSSPEQTQAMKHPAVFAYSEYLQHSGEQAHWDDLSYSLNSSFVLKCKIFGGCLKNNLLSRA